MLLPRLKSVQIGPVVINFWFYVTEWGGRKPQNQWGAGFLFEALGLNPLDHQGIFPSGMPAGNGHATTTLLWIWDFPKIGDPNLVP